MEQQIPPEQPFQSKFQPLRNKKGRVILLLLIALVALIGGYFTLAKIRNLFPFNENRSFTTRQQTVEDKFQKPFAQEEAGVIAMVIKKENYDSLVHEISTWISDVEKETKYKIEIQVYENNVNKEKIKADLRNLYHLKNLQGVVLVGNIPYARAGIHCSSYPTQFLPCLDYISSNAEPFDTQNLNIDDYFYTDIDNKCQYNQAHDAFYTDSCSKDSSEQPFWISRLTSPIHEAREANILLRNYFEKNHKFRDGQVSFDEKFLIYGPVLLDLEKSLREANVKNFLSILNLSRLHPYKNTGIKFLPPESSDNAFFDELNHKYEYVLYNGHGTPFFQQKNINYETIVSKAPKALLYEFGSCSVGRYLEERYLAGAYLFKTDALIALAAQTPIFVAFQPNYHLQRFLASGKSIGDASKMSNLGAYRILGDGTLKLRYYKEPPADAPKILLDKLELDLEKLSLKEGQRQTTIAVKNVGKTTLVVNVNTAPPSKLYPVNAASVGTLNSDDLILQPNESREIPLNVAISDYGRVYNPSETRPKAYVGKYSGFFYIYTNDPNNYIVRIPFEGEITE